MRLDGFNRWASFVAARYDKRAAVERGADFFEATAAARAFPIWARHAKRDAAAARERWRRQLKLSGGRGWLRRLRQRAYAAATGSRCARRAWRSSASRRRPRCACGVRVRASAPADRRAAARPSARSLARATCGGSKQPTSSSGCLQSAAATATTPSPSVRCGGGGGASGAPSCPSRRPPPAATRRFRPRRRPRARLSDLRRACYRSWFASATLTRVGRALRHAEVARAWRRGPRQARSGGG